MPSRTLSDLLAVSTESLLLQSVPSLCLSADERAQLAQRSVVARMRAAGSILLAQNGLGALDVLRSHPSDTVRGFAAFVVGAAPALPVEARLLAIRPSADDVHFGVREWAWLALRESLSAELPRAIAELRRWTAEESPNLRRFASEALRPRGVWSRKIDALLHTPALGEPLLEPLRADPSRYVQDSVGNWINDAAKSQPEWAEALCARWLRESDAPATSRIARRGLRSLR